jgi:hypothetical protein
MSAIARAPQGERAVVARQCQVIPAARRLDDGKDMGGVEMAGLGGQDLSAQLLGIAESAGIVRGNGVVERLRRIDRDGPHRHAV